MPAGVRAGAHRARTPVVGAASADCAARIALSRIRCRPRVGAYQRHETYLAERAAAIVVFAAANQFDEPLIMQLTANQNRERRMPYSQLPALYSLSWAGESPRTCKATNPPR